MRRKQLTKSQKKWLYPRETFTVSVTLPTEWQSEIDQAVDRVLPGMRDREDFLVKSCEYALSSLREESERKKRRADKKKTEAK